MSKVERLKALAGDLARRGYQLSEDAKTAEDSASLSASYHEWYGAARALVHEVMPPLEEEFTKLYHGISGTKMISGDFDKSGIPDAINRMNWPPARNLAVTKIRAQAGLVAGLPSTIDVKALDLKSLAAYDLMKDELEAAGHLVERGYNRAAGAVTAVVFERHLKHMCDSRKITLGPKETVGMLNDKLKEKYADPSDYKRVSWLNEIRILCDHDKGPEPDSSKVKEFIAEVTKFIATVS